MIIRIIGVRITRVQLYMKELLPYYSNFRKFEQNFTPPPLPFSTQNHQNPFDNSTFVNSNISLIQTDYLSCGRKVIRTKFPNVFHLEKTLIRTGLNISVK